VPKAKKGSPWGPQNQTGQQKNSVSQKRGKKNTLVGNVQEGLPTARKLEKTTKTNKNIREIRSREMWEVKDQKETGNEGYHCQRWDDESAKGCTPDPPGGKLQF